MAAIGKRVTLLVLVALLAATSFSGASALDLASSQGSNGRKFLFESAEQIFTTNSFSGASTAQQEREVQELAANRPNVDLTPATFSTKPHNTPVPPYGPAPGGHESTFAANQPNFQFTPGTFSTKPRNTPVPPHGPAPVEFTPGTFSTKPRNTPVPPHGPAPGEHTDTFFSRVSGAHQEIDRTPGTIVEKPLNTRETPHVGPAPGLFGLKPWKTPVSPAGAAPGDDTNTYFSRVSGAHKEREVNKGFNRGGAILLPYRF